jgi:aspartate kinase
VSVTLDNTENLQAAVRDLAAFSSVTVDTDLGLICVVGHGIRHRLGIPARVLQPLREAQVVVRMISLGALKTNVSLVVAGTDLDRAVRALHRELFGS